MKILHLSKEFNMVCILYGKTYKYRRLNIPTKILDPYNMLFVGWNFSFQGRNKKAPAFAGALHIR